MAQSRFGHQIHPTCMLRTPVLSRAQFDWVFASPDEATTFERIEQLMTSQAFREMVLLASVNTHLEWMAFQQDPGKFTSKRKLSLFTTLAKFIIRATTRPTPFGWFSGVAALPVGEPQPIVLNPTGHRRTLQADTELAVRAVDFLQLDLGVMVNTTLHLNSTAQVIGNRLFLWAADHDTKTWKHLIIKLTPPLRCLLRHITCSMAYPEALQHLKNQFPRIAEDTLQHFIIKTLQQRIFFTSLMPTSNQPDWVEQLLHRSKDTAHAVVEHLKDFNHALHTTRERQGDERLLLSLTQHGEAQLLTRDNLLKGDCWLGITQGLVDQQLAQDVCEAMHVLLHLNCTSILPDHLASYTEEFLWRYGIHTEVPLLTLLDPDLGMGPPDTYEYPFPARQWKRESPQDAPVQRKFLVQKVTEALQFSRQEVVIEDHDLALLSADSRPMPHSFDVLVQVAQPAGAETPWLVLSGMGATFHAGQLVGRFAFNEPEFMQLIQDEIAASSQEDAVVARLNFIHPHLHFNNVNLSPASTSHQISLGTGPDPQGGMEIPLSEIVVVYHNARLCLKDRRSQKRIVVRNHMMANTRKCPNVVRFLIEVAGTSTPNVNALNLGMLEYAPVLPRIRYRNTVLQLRRWLVPSHLQNPRLKFEAFIHMFEAWQHQYEVPRHVLCGALDNKLVLDTQNVLHQRILHKELHNGHGVLEEHLASDTGYVTTPDGQPHASELAFSFLKQEPRLDFSAVKNFHPSRPMDSLVDCLYFKLYAPQVLENDILMHLSPLLSDNCGFDAAFFLRYRDPGRHLRLRFLGRPEVCQALLPRVLKEIQKLKNQGFVHKCVTDDYEPEVNRYGGPESIKVCEKIFHADSLLVAGLIQLMVEHRVPVTELAFYSSLQFLKGLHLPDEARQPFFHQAWSNLPETPDFKRFFLQHRKTIWNWLSPDWVNAQPFATELQALTQGFHGLTRPLANELVQLNGGWDSATHQQIVHALCHMHLNRLGIPLDEEYRLHFALDHTLKGFAHYRPSSVVL